MLPTQQYQVISDTENDLLKRGNAWKVTVGEREEAARGLEVLGFDDVARRLRHLNDCLTRRSRMAVAPPATGRPLKARPAKPPLLMVVPDQGPSPDDSSGMLWGDLHDFVEEWLPRELPASDVRMLTRIDEACAARRGTRRRRLQRHPSPGPDADLGPAS